MIAHRHKQRAAQALADRRASRRSAGREEVFRAIADPTRREILSLLRGGRLSVGELAANFRTSRPAISKHLRSEPKTKLNLASYREPSNACARASKQR